ncbi:class I SAM-dependent methyltransferase [Streptomyces gobiensis]|uniref:class I SAM-dependent methyltransferase n=1 Tax=Streptomyces gobiensis TaxID=2875706 RepID=UPI001E5DB321|nr:class I SAM-dependent methyltransferase [Streptomyces gobiensis]UGY91885.1 class I SAM-dependent methyltransferase [Streptomyces gobiensis]
MDEQLQHHYTQLADTYDDTWGHRPAYLDWMEEHISRRLRVSPGEWIADIGAGTGLFLRRLLPYATEQTPVVCVDPSAAMLARLPQDPRLHPVQATAEELAAGQVELPCDTVDALVIKEAVHHFTDLDHTLVGLADQLSADGRVLIVTLPPQLKYPLFQTALDRFAAGQPEPESVAAALRKAGLKATTTIEEFPVSIERDRWLRLVANRWMSVLSTFSDTELSSGLEEIAEEHPSPQLEFPDRFAFILGHR